MAEEKREEKRKSHYKFMKVLEKTDRFLKKGADIFEIAAKLGEKPSTSGVIHAGMKLTQHALGLGFFDEYRINQWPSYHPNPAHSDAFFEILATFPRKVYGQSRDDSVIFYDFYGRTVARQQEYSYISYIESETTLKELSYLFARAVWEKIGSPCVLTATGGGPVGVKFEYAAASATELYDSEKSTEIMGRIKPFLEREVSRSVLLYGPPGTGKSCIINRIAAAFGTRVLSVDVSNLAYCSSAVLTKSIINLQPDVLVINDLDRFSGSAQMLTTIEELNKALKLLLVSVNDLESLPKAVIRPGRFDDIIEINRLDDKVTLKLIGIPRNEIPDAIFEELTQWPAAFAAELGKRIKYLGRGKLVEEFASLQKRVIANRPEEEPEECETAAEAAEPPVRAGRRTARGL